MNMPGFQEYGQSATTLAVSGLDKVNVVVTPMLEVGGRYAIGTETILRPYAVAGMTLLPDNNEAVVASFTGPLAFLGSFQQSLAGPTLLGNVEAGLQIYRAHGAEMRVEYKLSAGDSFLSQSANLRGAYHF
jgi:hypothetical protein